MGMPTRFPHLDPLPEGGGTIACLGCLLCCAQGALATANPPRPDIPALCKRVKPAFVFIDGGSGVVVSPSGRMLTKAT